MTDSYVALDLETTGLNPKTDRVIEIGALKVRQGVVSDIYTALVKPGRTLPEKVAGLTGITEEMLKGPEVKEQKDAMADLIRFTGELPLLGHSILFDYSFIKRFAVNHGMEFEKKGIDTLKLARKYLPDLESRRLVDLCAYYQIDTGRSHRAVEDAMAAHELYRVFGREFYEKGTAGDFEPETLVYRVKREGPATPAQKERLEELLARCGERPEYDIESLTKNEASRYTDKLIAKYGR